MLKRKIIFGDYDTAAHGWTLAGWQLTEAAQKLNYVEKIGGDGSWDLSSLGGIPRFMDRTLTVTLECSEGDRLSREAKIRHLVNLLHGMREDIVLPDDETHYLSGRLHVVRDYNDPAHAAVTVTATCEPWKYSSTEKVITVTATSAAKTVQLVNDGRRAVVPLLKVEGSSASVQLTYGSSTLALSTGSHQWPDLLLTTGSHTLTYSGSGSLTITYREAVLE